MRWPWRAQRQTTDPDLKKRISEIQQQVEQQSYLSEQAVQGSKELTARAGENRTRADTTQSKNHYAEGLAAAFDLALAQPSTTENHTKPRSRRWGKKT